MPRRPRKPLPSHRACGELTRLTLEHLPRDRSVGKARRWRKGATVWSPSDPTDRLYFLQRGQVAIFTPDAGGHEAILHIVNPREPFGELCFCAAEEGRRHSRAKAVLESVAIEVSYEQFLDSLQRSDEALSALAFSLCTRLSDAERRIEVLAHRGAEQRLGRLLLQEAARDQAAAGSAGATLRISHEDLARMGAMSRPHVTVMMGSFRRRGLVRYGRGKPVSVNVPALRAFVDRPDAGPADPLLRKRS